MFQMLNHNYSLKIFTTKLSIGSTSLQQVPISSAAVISISVAAAVPISLAIAVPNAVTVVFMSDVMTQPVVPISVVAVV